MADDMIKGKQINSEGFGTIAKLAMQDRRLHIAAKAIYAYFNSFAGGGDTCFPTRKKICFDLGISNDTLSKYLRQLTECGYISVEQIKEGGRFSHNVYVLNETISPCPKISDTVKTVDGKLDTNINSNNINSIYNNNKDIYTVEKPSADADMSKSFSYRMVIELYNSICVTLPSVAKLTDYRKQKIRNASSQIDGKFEELFIRVDKSDFLSGRNGLWRNCCFDWILKPANLIKIIEGNYDNKADYPSKGKHWYEGKTQEELDKIF